MVTQRIRAQNRSGDVFYREHFAALCLAALAVCLVAARACLQNITIDEATSYLLYGCARTVHFASQWFPASGNHVLNSLLMRLFTAVFGISELTVRIPAILGALVYIGSALYLCLLLSGRKLLQVSLLICLIYNPIILDYLVAARGYGLAIGFLLAAIALIANMMVAGELQDQAAVLKKCAWVSALLALSFAANFSFAIADGTIILVFFLWLAAQQKSGHDRYVRLAVSFLLPGIVIIFVICGSVLWEFPKSQLYFGSQSLAEMWTGLSKATFDDPNPNIVNPLLLPWLYRFGLVLPYITVFTILFLLASIEMSRWRARRRTVASLLDDGNPRRDGLLAFTRLLVVIAVTTLLLHWLAFHLMQLLLPKDRTALFFVTFWTLAFGGAVAVRLRKAKWDVAGSPGLGVLIVVALYFFGCLRLGYFREWKWDMDTKQVYWILTDLNRRCGITDFGTDWRYNVAMNFYREAYGNRSLQELAGSSSGELPTDKSAYAIFLPASEEFIKQQRLQVIYKNDESGSVVAFRGCPAKKSPDTLSIPAAPIRH